VCKVVVTICYSVGFLYAAVCVFSAWGYDGGFYGHYQALYGFGPVDPTSYGGHILGFFLRASNFMTLSVVLFGYSIVIGVNVYRRLFGMAHPQGVMWYSAELRLTAICLSNFIPYTVYTVFHTVVPPTTEVFFLLKTLLGLANVSTNSWLLLLFSSVTRRNLPLRCGRPKKKISDVTLISHTELDARIRLRSMAPVTVIIVKQRSRSQPALRRNTLFDVAEIRS
ncbi:hypothetical protein AAVH_39268, partial [Aphelenchoides avenae]